MMFFFSRNLHYSSSSIGRLEENMKKIIPVMICAAMAFSMTACCKEEVKETSSETTTTAAETSEETEAEESESIKEPEWNEDTYKLLDKFSFKTVDREGNEVSDSVFADHELTMINLWEPWCGPCVEEMPEIQKLYDNYKSKGFYVIGVYTEDTMEEDVDMILEDAGINYSILKFSDDFSKYQTSYVPTTFFVDKDGKVVDFGIDSMGDGSPCIVGANTYEGWESIINLYLEH